MCHHFLLAGIRECSMFNDTPIDTELLLDTPVMIAATSVTILIVVTVTFFVVLIYCQKTKSVKRKYNLSR